MVLTIFLYQNLFSIPGLYEENLPIHIKQLDVTDDMSVKNTIQAISSETGGRIDILVNNAGYGLNGAFEDLAMDEIKAQYETNVFGLIIRY
jgi:NAD(P)-dependent dehydrogenase (short-subunit alcohol dehydrogenase family)